MELSTDKPPIESDEEHDDEAFNQLNAQAVELQARIDVYNESYSKQRVSAPAGAVTVPEKSNLVKEPDELIGQSSGVPFGHQPNEGPRKRGRPRKTAPVSSVDVPTPPARTKPEHTPKQLERLAMAKIKRKIAAEERFRLKVEKYLADKASNEEKRGLMVQMPKEPPRGLMHHTQDDGTTYIEAVDNDLTPRVKINTQRPPDSSVTDMRADAIPRVIISKRQSTNPGLDNYLSQL